MGFLSRITGVFLASLAFGLMHSAGWLGPTCLDEWQIASLLILIGVLLAVFGSGGYSLDSYLDRSCERLRNNTAWKRLTRLEVVSESRHLDKIVISVGLTLLIYVVGTNQLLHGGVWGQLHNDSVQPNIVISDFTTSDGKVSFTAFRDKGPETYGAFIVEINMRDNNGHLVHRVMTSDAKLSHGVVLHNYYINQVVQTPHSLVFPLGSKAIINIPVPIDVTARIAGGSIELVDVSERVFAFDIGVKDL